MTPSKSFNPVNIINFVGYSVTASQLLFSFLGEGSQSWGTGWKQKGNTVFTQISAAALIVFSHRKCKNNPLELNECCIGTVVLIWGRPLFKGNAFLRKYSTLTLHVNHV